jgi:hypothetical protein
MTSKDVETFAFERSQGRKPRGRGCWAFTFDSTSYRDVSEVWFAPGSMLYQEAKKLAVAEGNRRGAHFAMVQP